MKTGYIHIQVNENYGVNGKRWYSCSAQTISRAHYIYLRRNFRHYNRESDENKYVVMANFHISSEQATRMVFAHLEGKFAKEDTGDWD